VMRSGPFAQGTWIEADDVGLAAATWGARPQRNGGDQGFRDG
jgi:hypothetical protein